MYNITYIILYLLSIFLDIIIFTKTNKYNQAVGGPSCLYKGDTSNKKIDATIGKKLKFEKLKLKADDGNKDALYHLALLYLNGSDEYDIKQDKKIAFNLLLEAVEKGNKFAKETLKLFNQ